MYLVCDTYKEGSIECIQCVIHTKKDTYKEGSIECIQCVIHTKKVVLNVFSV